MIKKIGMRIILKYIAFFLKGFYEYHIESRYKTLAPRELMFAVTYRCNARCVMCNIWKGKRREEMSSDQIAEVLSDNLFKRIQVVNITGGEPTLRDDLGGITRLLIDKMPELKKITLTSNALDTRKVIRMCIEMAEICDSNNIDFFVGISLDGIGKVHDEIRNIPQAFDKVNNTISKIREMQKRYSIRFGINCTIIPKNIGDVYNVYNWCEQRDIDAKFIVASCAENYYWNKDIEEELKFKEADKSNLLSFLEKLAEKKSLLNFSAYYYDDVVKMFKNGKKRTTPCVFSLDAFMLDPYGNLFYCMYGDKIGNCLDINGKDLYYEPKNLAHRKEIIKNKCPECIESCFLEIGMGKELLKHLKFLLGR
jgi:MoaA/NifB/PqqE/SkfB family radical SAM enzyme